MASLLDSILSSMEKPPTSSEEEKKKQKELKEKEEKRKVIEKKHFDQFREKTQKRIEAFLNNAETSQLKLEPMDTIHRGIVHEIAEIIGVLALSFGTEEVDRHIVLWKKECAPSDEELEVLRRGEEWSDDKAKEIKRQKQLSAHSSAEEGSKNKPGLEPKPVHQKRFERILDSQKAKEALEPATRVRSYGMVSSESKRDRKTIEETMAEIRAKKMKKS